MINIKKGKLFSLVFMPKYPCNTEFDSYYSYYVDNSNVKFKIWSNNPKVAFLDMEFLLTDLNSDKKVDQTDYELFLPSYGTKYGESKFDEDCDFNQDMIVDSQDLIVVSKEMGKEIE